MKVMFLFLFLCCGVHSNLIENKDNVLTTKGTIAAIDGILNNLRNEEFDEETVCLEKIVNLLEQTKNNTLWAVWTWDAMQPPVGQLFGSHRHLGNYDQCLKTPWMKTHPGLRTQYCLATVRISDLTEKGADGRLNPYSSAEVYTSTLSYHGEFFNTLSLGVCLPAVCESQSIMKFVRAFLLETHLGYAANNSDNNVEYCEVSGAGYEYPTGFYVFLFIITTLFLTTVVSTYYVNAEKRKDSLVTNLAQAFCMVRNTSELTKTYKDEISVLHGVRILNTLIIIYLHQYRFMGYFSVFNGLHVDKEVSILNKWFLHVDIVTDTYMTTSGLLLARSCMNRLGNLTNPFKSLLQRYFRLVAPLSVMVCFMAFVMLHTADGPLWKMAATHEQNACLQNGWVAILMLGNYINTDNICYGITWYIPVDYHMAIFGTFLFLLYQRHRIAGLTVFWVTFIYSILIPGLYTYWYQLKVLPMKDFEIDFRVNTVFHKVYMPSHMRLSSFLVGVAMGCFMSKYKPQEYRNAISKKLSSLITAACLLIMFYILALGGKLTYEEYNLELSTIYASLNRPVWALAFCVLLAMCEYGCVPLISKFLGWSVFLPLSRLSYCLYLVNAAVIYRNIFATRTPYRRDIFLVMMYSGAVFIWSLLASYIMWLTIEAPTVNLCAILFKKKEKQMNTSAAKDGQKIKDN